MHCVALRYVRMVDRQDRLSGDSTLLSLTRRKPALVLSIFDNLPSSIGSMRAVRLYAPAVTAAGRGEEMLDVPTFGELVTRLRGLRHCRRRRAEGQACRNHRCAEPGDRCHDPRRCQYPVAANWRASLSCRRPTNMAPSSRDKTTNGPRRSNSRTLGRSKIQQIAKGRGSNSASEVCLR